MRSSWNKSSGHAEVELTLDMSGQFFGRQRPSCRRMSAMRSPSDSKRQKLRKLKGAFSYAFEYVFETTQCQTLEQISNGYCDVWAKAVKRKAPFVELRIMYGHHWYIVFDDVAYDSDTTESGFSPPE